MYNRYYSYAYIAFSILPALLIVLSVKPQHRKISFIITYWFLIVPVVRSRVFRSVNPFAAITGQTWRIDWTIAILFFSLLMMRYITNKKGTLFYKKPMLAYEKYFYAYLYWSLFITIFHVLIGNIDPKYTNIRLFTYYQAILLYFVLIRFLDSGTIKCIFKAVLYMSIISSVIAPIQFFINTWFMRMDQIPKAFDLYHRITGMFQTPYDYALLVIVGMFLVVFTVENKFIKSSLITLFSIGILLTYSRGVWVTALAVVVIYFVSYNLSALNKIVKIGILIGLLIFMIISTYLPSLSVQDNNMMQDRVLSDTVTPRMEYNLMVFSTIADKWMFGYGDKENNEVYYKWMYVAGGRDWASGHHGGIHNLILQELFFKGTFAALFLALFFYKFFRHSYSLGIKEKSYLPMVGFYYTFAFLLYMMTAAAFLSAYVGILVIIFVAITSSVYYNNIDLSEFGIIIRKNKLQLHKENRS